MKLKELIRKIRKI